MTRTLIWEGTFGEGALPEVGERVAGVLRPTAEFCLWLYGPLGAGKTALTREVLRAFGLAQDERVLSPTFTYVNEYRIGTDWFAHLDLYRAGPGANPEDMGLIGVRNFRGFFVEWPEQIPASPALAPTHVMEIAYVEAGTKRAYRMMKP